LEQLEQQQQLQAIRALLDVHAQHQQQRHHHHHQPQLFLPSSVLVSSAQAIRSLPQPQPLYISDAATAVPPPTVPSSPVQQQQHQLIQQLLQLKLPPPPPHSVVVDQQPPPPSLAVPSSLSLLQQLLHQIGTDGGANPPEEAKLSEAIAAALSAHQQHVLMH
uniref:Homeotic protein spalt-major n=1 Tax=Globodera pallida TaxID=36090 RepID=A0A183CTT6_GLOPA